MEWLQCLNGAIDYIEENLDGEIDVSRAAKIACCSAYHFQRMFSYMADVPLSEYIRRRRMTKAAFDIQNSDEKIIDIALRYGYDSPTAFNRAFQSVHGVAPSAARNPGVIVKAFPPISFRITIKGEAEMNYRIEQLEEIKIIGVKKHYIGGVDECFADISKLWQENLCNGTIAGLAQLINKPPFGMLGVSIAAREYNTDFDYYIAASTNKKVAGFEEAVIPACTWAVFECVGKMPEAFVALQKRIVTEWFPSSGYEFAQSCAIEVYPEGDQTTDDYKCEIWLPVRKKA